LIAGYRRGYVDAVIQQLVDTLLSIPSLLLVLALVAAFGRTLTGLMLVLGASGWAQCARVIRGVTISLSKEEFVDAAKAVGAGSVHILRRHLLPNAISPIIVLATLTLSEVILMESALSFLGLGPSPPEITWGGMIGDGRNYIYQAWWTSVLPGVFICATVLVFNYLGDLVREVFDPFTVRRRE
jgi:peptide/nickel transport system permease protein